VGFWYKRNANLILADLQHLSLSKKLLDTARERKELRIKQKGEISAKKLLDMAIRREADRRPFYDSTNAPWK
jgi:hypothetical protein